MNRIIGLAGDDLPGSDSSIRDWYDDGRPAFSPGDP
jgi:hypothetical protein